MCHQVMYDCDRKKSQLLFFSCLNQSAESTGNNILSCLVVAVIQSDHVIPLEFSATSLNSYSLYATKFSLV